MLYGSVQSAHTVDWRQRKQVSLLTAMGADVRILIHLAFHFLMMHRNHIQKLVELRNWFGWSEGMVWCFRNDMER